MLVNAIQFPTWLDPVLVEIPLGFTTLPIRWYALAYIAGIWFGYLLAKRTLARVRLIGGVSSRQSRVRASVRLAKR